MLKSLRERECLFGRSGFAMKVRFSGFTYTYIHYTFIMYVCMYSCVRMHVCALFTAYQNKPPLVNANVGTAKTLKYDLVMIWKGSGKQDGPSASCKVIATRTIVMKDRKFMQWNIRQISELLESNYVVKDPFIVHFLTKVLNAFFFRMHVTYRIHHTVRDFSTLIITGKEKLRNFSLRKWRRDGSYERFQ